LIFLNIIHKNFKIQTLNVLTGFPAKTQTGYLPNKHVDPCRYTNLLGSYSSHS